MTKDKRSMRYIGPSDVKVYCISFTRKHKHHTSDSEYLGKFKESKSCKEQGRSDAYCASCSYCDPNFKKAMYTNRGRVYIGPYYYPSMFFKFNLTLKEALIHIKGLT